MHSVRQEKISLLIVDDEPFTREGLYDVISQRVPGIDIIHLAEDGEQALKYCTKNAPSILLSDVRMPRMDGLELTESVKKICPNCRIVFMSGYSDKAYLLHAIQVGAVRYIEKPIDKELLCSLLEQLAIECGREQLDETKKLHQSVHFEENEAIFQQQFALRLTQPNCSPDEKETTFSWFLRKKAFLCVLIKPIFVKQDESQPHQQWFERIRRELRDSFGSFVKAEDKEGNAIVFLAADDENGRIKSAAVEFFSGDSLRGPGNKLHVAIGTIVQDPKKTYTSYQDAVIALQRLFFYESDKVLAFSHNLMQGKEPSVSPEISKSFVRSVRSGDEANARREIIALETCLQTSPGALPSYAKSVFYTLIKSMSQDSPFLTDGQQDLSFEIINHINNIPTLRALRDYAEKLLADHMHLQSEKKNDYSLIAKVKTYVESYFHDKDLNMQDISKGIHVSMAHMCTVFKQETDITIHQYITAIRIERAKELLQEREHKVFEVADLIGYEDQNYFSRVFKKEVGITPTEYRNRWAE